MFKDEYHPQVKKDFKSLDKSVIIDIREKRILNVINNSFAGDVLSAEFSGIYSYHFKKKVIICALEKNTFETDITSQKNKRQGLLVFFVFNF